MPFWFYKSIPGIAEKTTCWSQSEAEAYLSQTCSVIAMRAKGTFGAHSRECPKWSIQQRDINPNVDASLVEEDCVATMSIANITIFVKDNKALAGAYSNASNCPFLGWLVPAYI